MVFSSLIRFAKFSTRAPPEASTRLRYSRHHSYKKPFFSSSDPYINTSYYYQALQPNDDFASRTRWWSQDNRQSTEHSGSFLRIADGHYGLYYSMYNHESERRERQLEYKCYIRRYLATQFKEGDRTKFKQCMFMKAYNSNHSNHSNHSHYHQYKQGYRNRYKYSRDHSRSRRNFHKKFLLFKLFVIGFTAKFIISRALRDTQVHIDNLKHLISRLSCTAFLKPTSYLLHSSTTSPLPPTSTPTSKSKPTPNSNDFISSLPITRPILLSGSVSANVFAIGLAKRAFTTAPTYHKQQVRAPRATVDQKDTNEEGKINNKILDDNDANDTSNVKKVSDADETDHYNEFNDHFLTTQTRLLRNAYEQYSSPQDLDVIYPIYQSIKRNGLTLPEVDLYNIVLRSIANRKLDSELEITAIENKLTNLLTVYQDLLCVAGLKPSLETYTIVVTSLLDASLACDNLPFKNSAQLADTRMKAKEFTHICFEILHSVHSQINLKPILPKATKLMKLYPELVSKDILVMFVPILQTPEKLNTSSQLCALQMIQYFKQFDVITNSEDTYLLIEKVYAEICKNEHIDVFQVYSAMMKCLMLNDFTNPASQLLDNILIDYKESLKFRNRPQKAEVGNLIADFLEVYALRFGILKAYNLMQKFSSVGYLPELPISLYNKFIIELSTSEDQFEQMWQLYDKVAVRKDFQSTSSLDLMRSTDISCRDQLLALSLQKGDHDRVFQLIKEILLKNHLIGHNHVLKMLLSYLSNGVVLNKAEGEYFNQHYFGLLCQVLESQTSHYEGSPYLNDFLSEIVPYLMVTVPPELCNSPMAAASVTNYNIVNFMRSNLVKKSIEQFDMQRDNLYGLVVIGRQLACYTGSDQDILKSIAQFEAKLISQFEDTENHYIELTAEVREYKNVLRTHFKALVKSLGVVDQNVEQAWKLIHDDSINLILDNSISDYTEAVSATNVNIDLSEMLNVNYKKGLKQFVFDFGQGATFLAATWSIVLNQNFVSNELTKMDCLQVLDRIWQSSFNRDDKCNLIARIISFDVREINEHIFNFINQNSIFESNVLKPLFESFRRVGTSRVMKLDIKLASSGNPDTKWIEAYLAYLKSANDLNSIAEAKELPLELSQEIKLLILEAEAESESANFEQTLVELGLDSKSPNDARVAVWMIKNDLYNNVDLSTVVSRFLLADVQLVELTEIKSYVNFLQSLQKGYSYKHNAGASIVSLNHLASTLLSTGDLVTMKQMIEKLSHQESIQLTTLMLDMLISAKSKHHATSPSVLNKLMQFVKFYKCLEISNLPLTNFLQIVQILKLTKSELLNVLATRLFGGRANENNERRVADIINFYFLEVRLFDQESKQRVSRELGNYVV